MRLRNIDVVYGDTPIVVRFNQELNPAMDVEAVTVEFLDTDDCYIASIDFTTVDDIDDFIMRLTNLKHILNKTA